MKKTPTIFKRNPEDMRSLLTVPNPAAQWVFDGEGIATRKYDGTCCLVQGGRLFKRRELKEGQLTPEGFNLEDFDVTTGKTVGWMPVDFSAKEDARHVAAFVDGMADGTYELLGPGVQGNPEGFIALTLLAHRNAETYADVPRDYEGLKRWLADKNIEGLVFHHPDGRMAKIKKRDFGMAR